MPLRLRRKTQHHQFYSRVVESLAFSTPHDVLQEVVAVVLVVPAGIPRPDLRQLRDSLKVSLHQPKWPEAIVYMNAVPKNNNKVLRTKLSERLGLPALTEDTILPQRHFEGVCPPPETSLTTPILQLFCTTSADALEDLVKFYLGGLADCFVEQGRDGGSVNLILAPNPFTVN